MSAISDFAVVSTASLAVLAAVQAAAYAIGRRIGRYNVVDVAWGLGFVAVAAVGMVLGHGDVVRRAALLFLVAVWGLRLSWHIHRKTAGRGEDPRYLDLLDRSGGRTQRRAVVSIFLTQGAAQWFVSLPLQVSSTLGPAKGGWALLGVAGLLLWAIGFVFEAVGDHQLHVFKSDSQNRGAVIEQGLWRWTRHPNYFGDSCVWWGLWLLCLNGWPSVITILAPAEMTYFLVHATGARLLERYLVDRPGYREYQQRTAFFIPWPPKSSSA